MADDIRVAGSITADQLMETAGKGGGSQKSRNVGSRARFWFCVVRATIFTINKKIRELSLAALKSSRPIVLDATAISFFSDDPETLFTAISSTGPVITTTKVGEFNNIFND